MALVALQRSWCGPLTCACMRQPRAVQLGTLALLVHSGSVQMALPVTRDLNAADPALADESSNDGWLKDPGRGA